MSYFSVGVGWRSWQKIAIDETGALLRNQSNIPFVPFFVSNSRDTYTLAANPPSQLDAGSRFAERRRFPRFAVDAPAELTDPIARSNATGRLIEISQGGCFVAASETPAVGSIVQLKIDKDDTSFNSWARLVYERADSGAGLRFIDVGADQMKVLGVWLRELKELTEGHKGAR